jgi:two-component system, OmpR family, sensor histidine kinase KdpD
MAMGRGWRRFLKRAILGSAGVIVITLPCRQLHASFAICSFLYLMLILVQSLSGDLPVSLLLSFEAVACLEYFFVDPRDTFYIAHAIDAIALTTFLITALVVTRLVSRVSAEAEAARLGRQRQARLYRLAQQLLTMEPQVEITMALPERFRIVFGMTAVSVLDADTMEIHQAGESRWNLARLTREAYLAGNDVDEYRNGVRVRRLQVGEKLIGCIGFEDLQDPDATAEPLAALAATFLERTRALRYAAESAAAAQSEVYRAAILDALAHEFKTPLATILAAAGGVREAGSLGPAQMEMIDTVEMEAARLGNLASRLLRMARVEREEVRPRLESVELLPLIEKLVEQHARRSPDRQISCLGPSDSMAVHADPELLGLALSQLLENACKYSEPGSAISICIEEREGFMQIRVSNYGTPIQLGEQHRIFDRFYRGAAAGHIPGSGLGLYVARKIAIAHGGALDFAPESSRENEVSFRLTIPTYKSESGHVFSAS